VIAVLVAVPIIMSSSVVMIMSIVSSFVIVMIASIPVVVIPIPAVIVPILIVMVNDCDFTVSIIFTARRQRKRGQTRYQQRLSQFVSSHDDLLVDSMPSFAVELWPNGLNWRSFLCDIQFRSHLKNASRDRAMKGGTVIGTIR
jgi:hypothetical protein